jgi:LacI family transcriptional regulator
MRTSGRSPTSHDVARLAGVSQPTVSRALRGKPGVSPETRRRVRDAADALGYVTSESARALATRRSLRVAVVASELANPFYVSLLGPLHDALADSGFRMILINGSDDASPDFDVLVDGSVDGVLLTTSQTTTALPQTLERHAVPFVFVNRVVDDIRADSCTVDNVGGIEAVAALLLKLGHRAFAGLFGPTTTSTSREREAALRDALAAGGIALRPEQSMHGDFTFSTGDTGFSQLMRAVDRPTAIVCGNDVIALGALNAANRLAIPVPSAVSIVGFDDIPMSSWDMFRLTTVRTDVNQLARTACRLLLRRIADPHAAFERAVVPAQLIERETHAAHLANR